MNVPANDNESILKDRITLAMENIFPTLLPVLFQGNLTVLSEEVDRASKAKNVDYGQLKQMMFEHEERLDNGSSLENELKTLQETLGSKHAAEAFVALHAVRKSAISLIVRSRCSAIAADQLRDGTPFPESFRMNGATSALRNSLARVLIAIGGLGEESAKQCVRRFEREANLALDSALGSHGPTKGW